MAKDVVEFSLSIEKFSFTFKGAREKGEALGQGLQRTMESLNVLQRQALTDSNVIEVEPAPAASAALPPRPKARRRKRSSGAISGNGGSPQVDGNGEDTAARRNTGASPRGLLVILRRNGVFQSPIGMSGILSEVHKLGYGGMKHSDISSPLGTLTKTGVLKREKGEDGKWLYRDGPSPLPQE